MKLSLLLLTLSAFFGIAYSVGCNCVAIRLDDIQDYWLPQTQIDVMNVFKNSMTPLTAVIIGKDFGDDSTIVNAIKSNLAQASATGWDFEVGNHGWQHDDFSALSLSTQRSWLSQARAKTMGVLKGYITNDQFRTFVPPFNAFNSDTINAAKSNNFTIFSAGADEYSEAGRSYPGNSPSFREWPMQAATTDLSDTYKISAAESLQMIKNQIATSGFSVLMMHFVEYSKNGGSTDQAALNDLVNLISMIKSAGIQITTLRGLEAKYFGTSSNPPPPPPPPSSPAPSPTPSPSPSSSVTTGKASSSSCTTGYMKCLTTTTYSTCNWNAWGPSQSCGAGTVCSPSGNYIYCIWANRNLLN